jgi:hypothetical protein
MVELLGAIKSQLPGDDRKPGEIAALVTDALRLHSAKLISCDTTQHENASD